jgi:hypothetical protein
MIHNVYAWIMLFTEITGFRMNGEFSFECC